MSLTSYRAAPPRGKGLFGSDAGASACVLDSDARAPDEIVKRKPRWRWGLFLAGLATTYSPCLETKYHWR